MPGVLGAFVAHEWRLQLRSGRFRLLATAYAILCSAPPAVILAARERLPVELGPSTYAFALMLVQPLATAAVAMLLSVDIISREADEGSLGALGVTPLSNSGYVLQRWLAVQSVLLPLTAVPAVAAYAMAAADVRGGAVAPFALVWLLNIVTLEITVSMLAAGLGTITGRIVLSVIAGVALYAALVTLANELLAGSGLAFHGLQELLAIDGAVLQNLYWMGQGMVRFVPPSEIPVPAPELGHALSPRIALHAGIAAAILGLAVAYLRRARRDLPPWRTAPDHPLRTLLTALNRLRQEFAPDPQLMKRDLLALSCGVALLAIGAGHVVHRARSYAALARERYTAERRSPVPPMAASLSVLRSHVRGTLFRDGSADVTVVLTLRNATAVPQRQLSFALNPALDLQAHGNVRRSWDRVAVTLPAPIPAGGEREIRLRISGTPARYSFALPYASSFTAAYERLQAARISADTSDLSRSTVQRLITPVHVSLDPADLVPVPRYTAWDLREGAVPPELIAPQTDIETDLRFQVAAVLADACGGVSRSSDAGTVLKSRCTLPLAEYRIRGGALAQVPVGTEAVALTAPVHAALGRHHAPAFARGIELTRTAWPELPVPRPMILVEAFSGSRTLRRRTEADTTIRMSGSLVEIPEWLWIQKQPLEPRDLAVGAVASAMLRQRPVAPAQYTFFRKFYEALAAQRLGVLDTRGAVRGPSPPPRQSLLNAAEYSRAWTDRLDPLLVDLMHRIGPERMVRSVGAFLQGPDRDTADARELFAAIASGTGVPLDRVYSDYVAGEALPILTLADVRFARAGSGWIVSGFVANDGDGEAVCPVAARTEDGVVTVTVRIGEKDRSPFSITTVGEPRNVALDPQRVCYRFAPIGTIDLVQNTKAAG